MRLDRDAMSRVGSVFMLKKIISGGQTGADRGGLEAAIRSDLEWGGWAPLGWVSEDSEIPNRFRLEMKETGSSDYRHRTKLNVRDSDRTIIFGKTFDGGSRLTAQLCMVLGKPGLCLDPWSPTAARRIYDWLVEKKVAVLNVAGNRESKAPGICLQVAKVLIEVIARGQRLSAREARHRASALVPAGNSDPMKLVRMAAVANVLPSRLIVEKK